MENSMDKKIKIALISDESAERICGFKRFTEVLAREGNMETARILQAPGKRMDLIREVKALQPEILITTDLLGFEQCTLTDNVSYNLLDCKQLHLLFHENLPNERYLNRQLSIAMFFYCVGNSYYKRLSRQYPELPYLKVFKDWQSGVGEEAMEKNAESLYGALREVLRECGYLAETMVDSAIL